MESETGSGFLTGRTSPPQPVGRAPLLRLAALTSIFALLGLVTGIALGAGRGPRALIAAAALLVAAALALAAGRLLRRALLMLHHERQGLRFSRVLLDNFMRHFPGNVYFKDHESRFVRVSDAIVRHLGRQSEADLLGKSDRDMFSGEHAEQAMRDEAEIMRSGRPLIDVVEKETFTDGRVGWVSTSKMPLRDEDGAIIGTFGVSLDVTARYQAERALRESEAFFDSLVNSLPQNIYCKDLEGRYTFGNRAFLTTTGRRLEDLLGKTDFDSLPPEAAAKAREEEQRVMRTGQVLEVVQESAPGSGGERRFVQSIKTPRYDAARQVVGVQGIFWDVTERRQAEQALGRERDLLHALMDNIPDPIFFKNAGGSYTRVNAAQARLLGLQSAEAAQGLSTLDADEAAIVKTGQPVVGKVQQVQAADGSSHWMSTTRVPIKDAAGQVVGIVALARDITERKHAEEALERGLEAFLGFASAVAAGDLTRRAGEGEDTLGRIGRSVNTVLGNFTTMLLHVRDAALAVASAAGQILAASRQIAQGAQRQTDEVNSTSTAVEEMAASMAQVSKNAESAARAALSAKEHVEKGDRSVSDTAAAMTQIDGAAARTAEKMGLLERRSREISEVIELIDDVAAQTKLLSLNAAIEAAHAGEAGLGFNVVAEEIRKLADRTARATKDVGALIEGIQLETAEALSATEQGVREVEQGRRLASAARAALQEIAQAVTQAAHLGQEISGASQQQAGVTRELARTMQTIAGITLESSTGAQQTANTVQDLVRLSNQLTEALERFRIPGRT